MICLLPFPALPLKWLEPLGHWGQGRRSGQQAEDVGGAGKVRAWLGPGQPSRRLANDERKGEMGAGLLAAGEGSGDRLNYVQYRAGRGSISVSAG